MKSGAHILDQAFTYDFARDGGTGFISTAIQVPFNSMVQVWGTYVDTQLTFGAGATFSLVEVSSGTVYGTVAPVSPINPSCFSGFFGNSTPGIFPVTGTLNLF